MAQQAQTEAATLPRCQTAAVEDPPESKVDERVEETTEASKPSSTPARGILVPLVWNPQFRRFSLLDGFLTVGFGASVGLSRSLGPRNDGPTAYVPIDEKVRDALRSPGYAGRQRAADVSDVLGGLSVTYALVGDPLVNAVWLRRSPDVGKQLALLNAEVTAVTLGVQQLTANLVGRERPYGRTCGTEIDSDAHRCEGGDRYRSFFSGHTSVPFALAASTCVSHHYLPLSGARGWIPCVSGFALAATTGTLRIVADYHYATDVLTGAAIGTAIGLGFSLSRYALGNDGLTVETSLLSGSFLPGFGGLNSAGRPVAGLTWMGVLR